MPSLSALMPWSNTLRRALSKAPRASPSGGPSLTSLSNDIASAAGEVLLRARADRLVRSVTVSLVDEGSRFNGGGGASELDLFLCGDRLDDDARWWPRVGDVLPSCNCCKSFNRCWVMSDGCPPPAPP